MKTGPLDKKAVAEAAALFVAARRSGKLVGTLPAELKPAGAADAQAIQEVTVALLGETIGGWKVGLPTDGQLFRGALLKSLIFDSPARIPAKLAPMLGVEAEIAFRFDRGLPPRGRDYSRDEVAAAVTAFPAIEVVATRFADYASTPPLDRAADCVSNGAFVRGRAVADWSRHDLSKIEVVLAIGGKEIVRQKGGHAAGDPILPAVALVNEFRRGPGVKAGLVVTTGTYTGLNHAKPGDTVQATFTGFGSAEIRFTA